MITLNYPKGSPLLSGWRERLEGLGLSYDVAEQEAGSEPGLIDGNKVISGSSAINDYIDGLEAFVKGWYEDRCDRYDFDPDAPLGLKF